ncbi:MAG TPA: DUF5131 family protein, partial [Planctomycetaceae bacterium]
EARRELEGPRLHALEAIRQAGHCDCLLLTKRPHLWRSLIQTATVHAYEHNLEDLVTWLEEWAAGNPPANVQIGTTAENQEWLDARFPPLMEIPARVRFLSCEPLLGPLSVVNAFYAWVQSWPPGSYVQTWPRLKDYLHHVIVGGESDDRKNNQARPMHPFWARGLRDECQQQDVPFHFKQWGDWADVTNVRLRLPSHEIRLTVDGCITSVDAPPEDGEAIMRRVFKQNAGRRLDGRTWDELPRVATHAS